MIKSNNNYKDYLAENLDTSISYSEYIAENMDSSINFSEYIAENLDKNISYSEYLAENLYGQKKIDIKQRNIRKEKIENIFSIKSSE